MNKDTHKYSREKSILFGECDEYSLSDYEYYTLYTFFVTYSMCGSQSWKKRSFKDYGWECNTLEKIVEGKRTKTALGNALPEVFDLNNESFIFHSGKGDITELYNKNGLADGRLPDCDKERAVISKTSESNKYMKLFYRIRNGLAHGKFILKYSSKHEKMVIIQDDDTRNVTARIILRLSTLMKLVEAIDANKTIKKHITLEHN